MGVDKYKQQDKDRCSPCPYCSHTNVFPKDLRMWCISEQVEKRHKRKMQMKETKKVVDESSGVSPQAIQFLADGNIRYEFQKKEPKKITIRDKSKRDYSQMGIYFICNYTIKT
jgi:hypothetical protein